MDLIHKFLNIILPPITFLVLLLFLPALFVFKILSYIKRSIFSENLAGKVVVITGASSGIGKQLAYEYARKGARLALAARREDRLRAVAEKARLLGSTDVIVIRADISKFEDCKRLIDETMDHFGQLDHLVNNAGVTKLRKFENCNQISDFATIMNTNFWGAVYSTQFAVPHLRKSKGRIIVISSVAGWFPVPKMSFYSASKAALIGLYETLRLEFDGDIAITIVTPGLVKSEIVVERKVQSKAQLGFVPVESTEGCAKAIVNSACRGDRYLTEPSWVRMAFLLQVFCPEVVEWCNHLLLAARTSKNRA